MVTSMICTYSNIYLYAWVFYRSFIIICWFSFFLDGCPTEQAIIFINDIKFKLGSEEKSRLIHNYLFHFYNSIVFGHTLLSSFIVLKH